MSEDTRRRAADLVEEARYNIAEAEQCLRSARRLLLDAGDEPATEPLIMTLASLHGEPENLDAVAEDLREPAT